VKLTRRLILTLMVAIVVVMAFGAFLQLRREITIFDDDMAQDERAMGHALRAAVETVAADSGIEQAEHVVAQAAASETRLNLRWVWLDDAATSGRIDPDVRTRLARGRTVHVVREDVEEPWRATYVPLRLGGPPVAALELSEPLAPQRRFLRRTELEILGSLLVLVGIACAATMMLGIGLVGRPMRALAEQARRIGSGDLSRRLRLEQRDEIGSLATELNAMCDRLAQAQARLRAETEARIATLEQLRHSDRLKTVGQLASGVAHELGTPLNVVAGRAKLIGAGASTPTELATSARIIAEQTERMTGIIRQLLDFARRRTMRTVVADLRDVVTRTIEMLALLARSRRVDLSLDGDPGPMPVRTDPNQLQQALTNLIVNGMQAMPNGGPLRIHLGARQRPVPSERSAPGRQYWSVVVEDAGAGIPPEHLPRVFEPFFTTKGVGEGTGLGLAVAHGIVAEHGGWIDVESVVGRGSRFEIALEAEVVASHAEAG
jgi:two-component system NtrC family sensor kinase